MNASVFAVSLLALLVGNGGHCLTGYKPISLSSSLLPPSPPIFSSSCDAMQNISQQLQILYDEIYEGHCEKKGCSSVHCSSTILSDFSITLRCSEPLGFEIEENNGTKTDSQFFSKSDTWYSAYANVTVVNVQNKSLGLAIYIDYYPVVEYTEVPIDSSACPDSSSASANLRLFSLERSSVNVVVVATSSVLVIALVLIVAVVLTLIGVVTVKRRRGRNSQMRFRAMGDEEED